MRTATIDIRRAKDRFVTRTGWLLSYHSFSFGEHRDPKNVRHGLLVVSNDDVIAPSSGFPSHFHQDMEIVTWMLEGELRHEDSGGHEGLLYPGLAQRMSAGGGILHSEANPSPEKPARLVQMWVLPDAEGGRPGYEQRDVGPELANGGLIPVASGRGHDAAISIRQRQAVLWAGRLKPGEEVRLPDARHVHAYVARGAAALEEAGPLAEGDAARLTRAGGLRLTADPRAGAEVLVWEMG